MSLHDDHRALIGVAASGFLFLSLAIAVLPAYEAQKTPPIVSAVPSAEVTRGRELYLREGCAVCHTQFVRNLAVEESWVSPIFALGFRPLYLLAALFAVVGANARPCKMAR